MRLEETTGYDFQFTVNAGEPVTVEAWLRKNAAYAGAQPSIALSGLGIESSASMTAGAETWEQLQAGGTPNADGVLTLTVETYGAAAGERIWIDDIAVTQ